MDSNLWRNNIIQLIEEIASKEYQELAWFGKANYISSPDEMICGLIDDFEFGKFLRNRDIALTNKQKNIGTLLQLKVNNFAENSSISFDPQDVIDHPDWVEIRSIAEQLLQEFNADL